MKIDRGIKNNVPVKVVIYGPEGIGKSTLASQCPSPLFLDIENGTNQLDVARADTRFKEWSDITKALDEIQEMLKSDPSLCKTLVIDTIDVAETLLSEQVVRDAKNEHIKSISDFAYGSGQVKLREQLNLFLKRLDEMSELYQINIILLAHSHIRKFEQPDETGTYDRYELKLTTKDSERVKEWCDVLLFLNYKTQVVSSRNAMEKNKVIGGKRVMYTTHHPAWDAKNRFGLDEELPLEMQSIAKIFGQNSNTTINLDVTEDDPVFDEPSESTLDDSDFIEITDEPTTLYGLMERDHVTEKELIRALVKRGVLKDENAKLTDIDKNFIQNNLINKWNGFLGFLRKQK